MRRTCRLIGLLVGITACVSGDLPAARANEDPPRGLEYALPVECGPVKRWPALWDLSVDYVFFRYTTRQIPQLATTGSTADAIPGALGQPNTQFLGTTMNDVQRPALYATLAYWLCDPEAVSLETSFFIMQDRSRSQSFQSDANGVPVLSRPFFDPVTNAEAVDVRALLGTRSGTISDTLNTRSMGAEINLKFWTPSVYTDYRGLNLFIGARWFRLEETYSNFDTTTDLGGGGVSVTYSDRFAADNQFFGGQFGGEVQYRFLGVTFSAIGKLAVGTCQQTMRISGQTVQTDLTTGAVVIDDQGLYAQPSNVGTFRRNVFAYMPEAGVKARLDLSHCVRIHVGYNVFALSRTIRPGDEIDRRVNVQVLQVDVPTPPALPAPPSFSQQFFRGQMLNLGLELRY